MAILIDETKRVLVQGITGRDGRARTRRKLTGPAHCDYCDHMTATLRETKAKLSEMVKLASQGQEVVITVHGKEVAKLVPLPSRERRVDREKWLKRLAALRKKTWTGRYGKTAQEIQDEDRADRI